MEQNRLWQKINKYCSRTRTIKGAGGVTKDSHHRHRRVQHQAHRHPHHCPAALPKFIYRLLLCNNNCVVWCNYSTTARVVFI